MVYIDFYARCIYTGHEKKNKHMEKYCVVMVTFANETDAVRVIDAAIENKLVACAQTFNITSHYTWQGSVCHAPEVMVFFKTTKKLYDALESKIKELHPYQIPEIIAIDIERGLPDYLKWIDTVTAQ